MIPATKIEGRAKREQQRKKTPKDGKEEVLEKELMGDRERKTGERQTEG